MKATLRAHDEAPRARRGPRKRVRLITVLASTLIATSMGLTGSAEATPVITFDGSPGSAAPPATLGPYPMTSFGSDPRAFGAVVSNVTGPTGTLTFDRSVEHYGIGNGWLSWSHGYSGDVYYVPDAAVVMSLPTNTAAFYFYVEPNQFGVFDVTATTQDGTTSGPIPVESSSDGGARYFGFYATGGATLDTISVNAPGEAFGFGLGEFGIAAMPAADTTPPTITLPPDVNVGTNAGCGWSGDIGTATATDDTTPSSGISIVASPTPSVYPAGTTTVTWTATDAAGNSSSGVQGVRVVDDDPPSIAAPPDLQVAPNSGATYVGPIGNATASDNCFDPTVTNDAPAAFPAGATVVTWTATDAFGNPSSATQLVTVLEDYDVSFKQPIDGQLINVARLGRVIPVKAELFLNGAEVKTGTVKLFVRRANGDCAGVVTDAVEAYAAGSSSSGNVLTWDEAADAWHYNLDTGAASGLSASTCYLAEVYVGNASLDQATGQVSGGTLAGTFRLRFK